MHITFAFFEGLLTYRNLAFELIDSKDGRASVKIISIINFRLFFASTRHLSSRKPTDVVLSYSQRKHERGTWHNVNRELRLTSSIMVSPLLE